MSITTKWNPKQKRLKEIIKKIDKFDESKELFLSMHSLVHFSEVTDSIQQTIIDEVCNGLVKKDFSIMPTEADVTIAWNIWHITRIEDLTMNILINHSSQVLTREWLNALKINVTDTGNAMTDDEIMDFSKNVDTNELIKYRNAVGRQSQKVLSELEYSDINRKVDSTDIDRILREGGVLEHPDSIWLLDFWSKKDVAGIILMPITRHQVVHLNDCLKLKNAISKKNVLYRV